METERMINELKSVYEKHKNDFVPTFQINISAMCADIIPKLEQLKHFEDLEEQGLLLKLPVAIGDTVYAYCGEFGILPYTVDIIVIDDKITYQCSSYSEPVGDCPSECLDEIEPDISDFGKTVFLTQAEAEEALKRMERGD